MTIKRSRGPIRVICHATFSIPWHVNLSQIPDESREHMPPDQYERIVTANSTWKLMVNLSQVSSIWQIANIFQLHWFQYEEGSVPSTHKVSFNCEWIIRNLVYDIQNILPHFTDWEIRKIPPSADQDVNDLAKRAAENGILSRNTSSQFQSLSLDLIRKKTLRCSPRMAFDSMKYDPTGKKNLKLFSQTCFSAYLSTFCDLEKVSLKQWMSVEKEVSHSWKNSSERNGILFVCNCVEYLFIYIHSLRGQWSI